MEKALSKKDNSYLGKEKLIKLLLKFSIPCIISLIISSSYNIVDSLFIGNSSLGVFGNAATGVVFPILIFPLALAWWVGDGIAAQLAILQGRNDTKSSHKIVGNGILLVFLMSIAVLVLGLIFKKPLLELFGATNNSYALADSYFSICLYFMPVYMLMNFFIPVIRSDGSPNYSLFATGVGAVLNIALDPLFLYAFNMGMEGVALATVISQTVSLVFCIIYLFRSISFRLSVKSFAPHFSCLKESLILGISSLISQFSIVAASLICNVQLKTYASLSSTISVDVAIGAVAVQTRIFTLFLNIVLGLAVGGQPIFGYNIGSGQKDRVKKLYKMIMITVVIFSALLLVLIEVYPDCLILPFGIVGDDPDTYLEYTRFVFRVYLCSIPLSAFNKCSANFFQSVGKPKYSSILSIARDIFGILSGLAFIPMIAEAIKPGSGIYAIFLAGVFCDIVASCFSIPFTIKFFKGLDMERESTAKFFQNVDTFKPVSKEGSVIVVSHQHGTNSRRIAKELAAALHIPFYCNEILEEVSKITGLEEEYLKKDIVRRKMPFMNNNLYMAPDVSVMVDQAFDKVIKDIANRGSCVIVGRMADEILKDYPNLVKVFLYGSFDTKVNNYMNEYNETKEAAVKYIKEVEKGRTKYYKRKINRDINDLSFYDYSVNVDCGTEETLKLLINYFKKYNQK